MYQLIAFVKFLIKSKNHHSVHSPFIYDFITKCLYDKTHYSCYKSISAYQKRLRKNHDLIEVTDLGVGSRVFNSKKRRISKIAKLAGASFSQAKLLCRLARYFEPKNVLELGTSLGTSTYALACANDNSSIISIEGCPNLASFASQQLKDFGLSNVHIENDSFSSALPKLVTNHLDLVLFDGHHDKLATYEYFEILLSKAHNDSVFIFHDIYWSKEMTEAWNLIKCNPKVSVTIDCFFVGFVFFRKEQVPEHFFIRL
jgi:predicted O-methyltransferase YrrM